MIGNSTTQIVIWDTSAINNLARVVRCDDLLAQMKVGHTHWIPAYIFLEIAATPASEERDHLLSVCQNLKGSTGRVLIDPWSLIVAAIQIFAEDIPLDREVLLKTQPEFEQAVDSGAFDDHFARIQGGMNRENLKRAEEFFAQVSPQFDALFHSGLHRPIALDEIVTQAFSAGLIQQNVRYYCESILKHSVDWQYAGRFAEAFPSIEAVICAFLIGHHNRSRTGRRQAAAGAIDLLAAAYLPVCDKFVSDDRDQQKIFRGVVKYCSLSAEVAWFSGDFKQRFSDGT